MNVVKIQRFSTHDGPGVRTVIFLKGCPLRCKWCHNPETQSPLSQLMYVKSLCVGCRACESVCLGKAHSFTENGHVFDANKCKSCFLCVQACVSGALEAVGKQMTEDEIVAEVLKDRAFYGETGGVTLSGGEPTFRPEECIGLLKKLKAHGLSTAIETCGYFPEKYVKELCSITDFFLWDIKGGDPQRHKEYVGADNSLILRNLLTADRFARHIILRCIVVAGVNDDEARFAMLKETYFKLKHCDGAELIPYHAYGGSKNEQLGYSDNGNAAWIPSADSLKKIADFLLLAGVKLVGD